MLKFLKNNKIKIILIVVIVAGGWYYYQSKKIAVVSTKYVVAKVEKGIIINTVAGSGQVTALNQVDVKPTISADIVKINVIASQTVKAGDVLAELDTKDLQTKVRDAKNSLDSARASLNLKLAGLSAEDLLVAQKSLESSKMSYENSIKNLDDVKRAADENLKKAQISLANAERQYNDSLRSKDISSDGAALDFDGSYDDAKATINSAAIALRAAFVAADTILNKSNDDIESLFGALNSASKIEAEQSSYQAKAALDSFEAEYNRVATNWKHEDIENLLNKTLEAEQSMKKYAHNMYLMLQSSATGANFTQSTLDSYRTSMSSQESSLNSAINSAQSSIQAIANAKLSLSSSGISTSASVSSAKATFESAENSLTQAGLDNKKNIESAENDIKSKKNSHESAQASYNQKIAKPRDIDLVANRLQINQSYDNYQAALKDLSDANIVAKIDGTVAVINQMVGEAASPSTILMSLITPKQLAVVTLNEVDLTKVRIGQKVNLTFNAIENLIITGVVAEIDLLGTVTQGVVSYTVKIAFDTEDERIKPQMSVAASIVTEEKLDVVVVPNAAIKTDNSGASYVEVLPNVKEATSQAGVESKTLPEKKIIEIGLSDDTNTEVAGGFVAGDLIVIKTIGGAVSTTAVKQTSALNMLGGGSGQRMGR